MMDFYVGQKVECVDAGGGCFPQDPWLKEGAVYTVRWVGIQLWYTDEPLRPVVLLSEIDRGIWGDDPDELGYRATRFRPLVETDISAFQAMLAPKPVNQRESQDA